MEALVKFPLLIKKSFLFLMFLFFAANPLQANPINLQLSISEDNQQVFFQFGIPVYGSPQADAPVGAYAFGAYFYNLQPGVTNRLQRQDIKIQTLDGEALQGGETTIVMKLPKGLDAGENGRNMLLAIAISSGFYNTEGTRLTFEKQAQLLPLNQLVSNPLIDEQGQLQVFVAPQGSDNNNGAINTPVKTLSKALTLAKESVSEQVSAVNIILRQGHHFIADTVQVDWNSDQQANLPLNINSYQGEVATLSGGLPITVDELEIKDGKFLIELAGQQKIRQLYVNGKKAIRSREPDQQQFFTIEQWDEAQQKLQVNQQSWLSSGLTASQWQINPPEMVISRSYNQNRLRVAKVESSNSGMLQITPFANEQALAFDGGPRRARQAFYLENAAEFVDQPGEYFFDQQNQQLIYFPRAGETAADLQIIVPQTETLLSFEGAKNVNVSGIKLAHTAWDRPSDKGFLQRQGGLYYSHSEIYDSQGKLIWEVVPAAISLRNSSDLLFYRNVFEYTGGNGINYYAGTHDNAVIGNVFNQIADTAIFVGVEQEPYPANGLENKDELIANNYFHKMGVEYSGSAAIFASFPNHLVLKNNEIDGSDNLGINLGWHNYEQDDTVLRNSWIYRNKIGNIGARHDDSGAIHTKNNQPNTRIEENHIYNVRQRSDYPTGLNGGSSGIYLDNYTKDLLLKNNQIDNADREIHLNTNEYFNVLLGNQMDDQLIRDNAGLEVDFQDIKLALQGESIARALPAQVTIPAVITDTSHIYDGTGSLLIDFEDDQIGKLPQSISQNIATGAGELEVEEKDGSQVVRFFDNYRKSTKRVQYLAQPTRLQSGKYAIEYRFFAQQTNNALYMALQQGNQVLGKTGISPKRSIRIWNGSQTKWHHRYAANRWYQMRVEVDLDNQLYRYLLDGQASPWYGFKGQMETLEAVVLYSEWGRGTFYLDDFRIEPIDD